MEKKHFVDLNESIAALENAVIRIANSLEEISSSVYLLESHLRCVRICDELTGHSDDCEFTDDKN